VIVVHDRFELDDEPRRVDRAAVWAFLSTDAYWGTWRPRDVVERQIAGAWRVVGAYESASGRMVGFARAVSDGEAYAYLADVYVLPDARGKGLGKELVRTMIERGPGARFRWALHTRDAHGLYESFDFAPADGAYLERRERRRPRVLSAAGARSEPADQS
jgi:GNAT superfamily N-acetyltransferase